MEALTELPATVYAACSQFMLGHVLTKKGLYLERRELFCCLMWLRSRKWSAHTSAGEYSSSGWAWVGNCDSAQPCLARPEGASDITPWSHCGHYSVYLDTCRAYSLVYTWALLQPTVSKLETGLACEATGNFNSGLHENQQLSTVLLCAFAKALPRPRALCWHHIFICLITHALRTQATRTALQSANPGHKAALWCSATCRQALTQQCCSVLNTTPRQAGKQLVVKEVETTAKSDLMVTLPLLSQRIHNKS